MTRFEVGKTYECHSVCDRECVWQYRIASRTAATIRTECGLTLRISKRLTAHKGAETVLPLGNYSMCPILDATKLAKS